MPKMPKVQNPKNQTRKKRRILDRINRTNRKYLLFFRMKSRSIFSVQNAYCKLPFGNHETTFATRERALLCGEYFSVSSGN
jgi:hypothetical protein